MYQLLELMRAQGMRTKYISGFITGWGKGQSMSLSNSVIDWTEPQVTITIEGDFTAANGPIFSDWPFDIRCMAAEPLMYRARFTRTRMQGLTHNGWLLPNNSAATVMFHDKLEMLLLPTGAAPEYPLPSFGWTNFAGLHTKNFFTWERTLCNVSAPTTVGAVWTAWVSTTPEDRWCPARTYNGKYLIDPNLSHHWSFNVYNPATPIEVVRNSNTPRSPVIISIISSEAAGVPTFASSDGNSSFAWTKAFSVTVGKPCKLLVDFTGNWSYALVTGVQTY